MASAGQELRRHPCADRADAADMMSEPVSLDSEIDNEASDYGTGFAPFFVPLSLWVGTMMVFMVLSALLEWGVTRLAETLRDAVPSPEEGVDERDSLIRVLRAGVVFIGTHEELARMLIAESWRTNRSWYATVHQLRTEAIGVITGQLEHLAERGRLRPDLDTGLAGSRLCSAWF